MASSNSLIRGHLLSYTIALSILVVLINPAFGAASAPKIAYNQDIRPILSENCFKCHGTDRGKRQADLRLDKRQEALSHGAIVPGHPEKSQLIARIMADSLPTLMPPKATHKSLTPTQKNLLARWIKEGAVYQEHWAYVSPQRPAVPIVKKSKNLVKSAIDAFLLSRQEQKNILPSPPADPRTLLRRVSLDLTGIPPTPEELRDFLSVRSPNAFEKVVDRLMKSPRYGERMAVPWLDVVRYADTVGFHGDQNQNAWAYRDYVINAFNNNKPFDQFTREQLAGDLISYPTLETRTATCFIRLTMMTREGGAQAKEYLAKYTADRVRTVGMAWLGSTLACCECHDHKYDPFSTKDFYSMGAFFADLKQWGVYGYSSSSPEPELIGVENDHPFYPEIKVDSPYLRQRIAAANEKIKSFCQEAEPKTSEAKAAYDLWRKSSVDFLTHHSDGWETPMLKEADVTDAAIADKPDPKAPPIKTNFVKPLQDGSLLLTASSPDNFIVSLHPESRNIAAFRIELLPRPENAGSILRAASKMDRLNLEAVVMKADGSKHPISFRYANANYYQPDYESGFEIIGIQRRGWKLSETHAKDSHLSTWIPDSPIKLEPTDSISFTFKGMKLGCIRIADSPFAPETISSTGPSAALSEQLKNRSALNTLQSYLTSTASSTEAFAKIKEQEAEILSCRGGKTPVMVAEAVTPKISRVLPRGNWQNENGEIVIPAVPHFLPQATLPAGKRLTRLDLANWIVSPENPLTARVFVNRLWKQFFGMGLSDQVDDIGTQGELPIHQDLLDWLALEFRDRGWDIKHIVKLIIMSSAYRQSSRPRPELRSIDPANRLFAFQNPRRLDAEFVRDNALKIAGLLNTDLGGPPVHPYQPAGYYANIQFPDRDYIPERDERQWRRGIYTHWQRTFLQPMLAAFGAPSREDCTAFRIMTNSPQQALTLLNDPEFVEAARVFAAHILASTSDDSTRLERIFIQALARNPRPNERKSLLEFLTQLRQAYHEKPDDAKKLLQIGFASTPTTADPIELAAWTSLCRVVLNLHETITRY